MLDFVVTSGCRAATRPLAVRYRPAACKSLI